jgi:hypothetical protein
MIERYGVEYSMQSKELRDKVFNVMKDYYLANE